MSRRRGDDRDAKPALWEGERTLADAEEDERLALQPETGATKCTCGSSTLVLQAFFEVSDGKLAARPLESETLTCPECGREYEPVELADGRIARGDFLGKVDLEAEEEEDFV